MEPILEWEGAGPFFRRIWAAYLEIILFYKSFIQNGLESKKSTEILIFHLTSNENNSKFTSNDVPRFYDFQILRKFLYRIVYKSFTTRSFFMDLSRFQFRWHTQIGMFSHMQKSVVRHFSRFNWISAGSEVLLLPTMDASLFSKALSALFQVFFSFGLPFSWDIPRNNVVALDNKLYRKMSEILTKINSNQMQ